VLNPDHPTGRDKARVFQRALGLASYDAATLADQIRQAVGSADASVGLTDAYGTRYTVDLPIKGPAGQAIIRTGWIIETGHTVPRLVTAFVK
jgi:hypothetical protein